MIFTGCGRVLVRERWPSDFQVRGDWQLVDCASHFFIVAAFSFGHSLTLAPFLCWTSFSLLHGCLRCACRSAVHSCYPATGHKLIPTIVVGRGREAAMFIREIHERPSLGYRIIGVVETEEVTPSSASELKESLCLAIFESSLRPYVTQVLTRSL